MQSGKVVKVLYRLTTVLIIVVAEIFIIKNFIMSKDEAMQTTGFVFTAIAILVYLMTKYIYRNLFTEYSHKK